MEHFYIDRYSSLDSFIHRLNPQVKFLSFFVLVIFITTTPFEKISVLSFYFVVILFLILTSKVPLIHFLKSYFSVFPFIIMVSVSLLFFKSNGFIAFISVLAKSFLSVLAVTLLTSTTKFQDMLKGLEKLKFPAVLLNNLSFMYRYVFILLDEKQRIERAVASKYFGGKIFFQFKILGYIIASLFINTFERSERIYYAMCSRMYDGRIKTVNGLKIGNGDIVFCGLFSLTIIAIRFLI